MPAQPWTYASLAQADRATLEKILLTGLPPDPEQLNGFIYCGWNHEWVGKLSGRNLGYNEIVIQDHQKYQGAWNVKMVNGRPHQLGYFRVMRIKDEPPLRLYRPYIHLCGFDYNLAEMNSGGNFFFRVIRDFVVLPNPGDHSLMLCKAYLRIFPFLNIFYCYFLLGHRQPIEYLPW